jgi:hypothetical protein
VIYMRGIEQVVTTRVYASDRDRLLAAVRRRNAAEYKARRIYSADGLRIVFDENVRLKKRNAYLEIELASMLSKANKLNREVNELKRNVYA